MVYDLLDPVQPQDFHNTPPKFVRMRRWTYHYTRWNETLGRDAYAADDDVDGAKLRAWWSREEHRALYMVPVSLETHEKGIQYVRKALRNGSSALSPINMIQCNNS